MRRSITASLVALALAAMTVGSVSAGKPVRGCSDDFEAWAYLDFREYLKSDAFYDSLPPEGQALADDILPQLDTDAWIAASESYDKNDDMILCLKQHPLTRGNFYGWVWNAVDNTSNH